APPGILALTDSPTATRSTSPMASGPAADRSSTRWGLPTSTSRARPIVPPVHSGASPVMRAVPMSTDRSSVTSSTRPCTVTVRRPASVATAISSASAPGQPPSRSACAKHRIPLPLISAREPSALRSSMRAIAGSPGAGGTARITPSAPIPVCRSQSCRAISASSGWAASGSSTTRKSLPRPWCLVRRMSPTSVPDARGRAARIPSRPRQLGGQGREQGGGVIVGVEPADAGIAPEPRGLPAGEPAGAADGQLERLVEGDPALQVGDQLPVAEGLAGRARHPPGVAEQAPPLAEQPRGHLLLVAGGDAAGHDLVRQAHADQVEATGRVDVEPGTVGRERSPAPERHLEGPDDAPPVGRLHPP